MIPYQQQQGSNNNNNSNNTNNQAVKYPLNRDFSEVLERGSLEDIARLVESTAPRPEVRSLFCIVWLVVSSGE